MLIVKQVISTYIKTQKKIIDDIIKKFSIDGKHVKSPLTAGDQW
jgi:hypothetical protein